MSQPNLFPSPAGRHLPHLRSTASGSRLLLLFSLAAVCLLACPKRMAAQDIDPMTGRIIIDTVMTRVQIKPKSHWLGVRWNYGMTGVSFSPDLKAKKVNTLANVSVLYTYYHPLWGYMDFFGLQTGLKYGQQGFTTEHNLDGMDQVLTVVELPFMSAFHIDFGPVRVHINAGPYVGYRLATSRPEGFDCYDRRWDYGVTGTAGIGYCFGPFEFAVEAGYQYSFSWLYYPTKMSDDWWMYSYPNQIMIGCSLHYRLGGRR